MGRLDEQSPPMEGSPIDRLVEQCLTLAQVAEATAAATHDLWVASEALALAPLGGEERAAVREAEHRVWKLCGRLHRLHVAVEAHLLQQDER